MTTTDIGVYTAAIVILSFIGRIVKASVTAIYRIAKAWQMMVPGFEGLTKEVKEIKELLVHGEEWMKRSDERTLDVVSRVGTLEITSDEYGQRISRLEGATH